MRNACTDPKINKMLSEKRQRAIRGINLFGRFLIRSRTVRMWQDGDGVAVQINWWNPLGVLWAIVATLAVFVTGGVNGVRQQADDIGLCLSRHWREHKAEREFITPDELKASS